MRERRAAKSIALDIPPDCIQLLRDAASVAVLTGAGVSKESGIATFREADGLWSRFDAQEVACVEAFRRDPKRVWDWYAVRRRQMAGRQPNPGHYALAAMERRVPRFTLVTQNIDGLHVRAGSRNVLELHGNISRVKCLDENTVVDVAVDALEDDADETPPRCPRCGAPLRPDVVWFGEMLPVDEFARAIRAAQTCDVFLSVGTSGTVEPAASLPWEAARAGAAVVEINPERTPLSPHASFHLGGPSGEVLPRLVYSAWPDAPSGGSAPDPGSGSQLRP